MLTTPSTVLSTIPYGESSRIARLATHDLGVVSVIAKGARRPKSPFGAALQLLSEGVATIRPSRHSDLHWLTAFDVGRIPVALAADIGKYAIASLLSEIMLRFAPHESRPETYEFFRHSLDVLEAAPSLAVEVLGLRTIWGLVRSLGFAPSLDRCARDGNAVDPTVPPIAFSASQGGVLCPLCALAQRAPTLNNALTDFASRSLAKCPEAKITVSPYGQVGPTGFTIYSLLQESSDSSCQQKKLMLHSPNTGQVLIGTVFSLEPNGKPVTARIAEVASAALNEPVVAAVAPFPLPDGIHAVSITKQSKGVGGFSYHGFVDASNNYLIMGTRGNLREDPGKTIIETIGLGGATHRGNPKAHVQIIELSDFECPSCAKAHKKVEPIIARNLDKVDYYRLDLPLFEHHLWALDAALGARALSKVAPAKYWTYVNFVFENQETIGKQSFGKFLQNFCEDNDLNWKAIEKIYRSPAEKKALIDQVSRAFDSGVLSTPTYFVNGQMLGFGPEGTFTIEAIKKAIGVK